MGEPSQVRRNVELPGEPFDGTLAEALGIVITDEMRAEFDALMDRIRQMERTPWPHELWVMAGRPHPPDLRKRWTYLRLLAAVGHISSEPTDG